jgi:hypothetical protein
MHDPDILSEITCLAASLRHRLGFVIIAGSLTYVSFSSNLMRAGSGPFKVWTKNEGFNGSSIEGVASWTQALMDRRKRG